MYVYFFCRFIKICDKRIQWATYLPGGEGGYSQMGYIMCRFIGYGVQAAKSGTGYRNQRETLGQGGIWEVQFSIEQQNSAEPEVQARCSSVAATHYHLKISEDPPRPRRATLKEQTRCLLLERYIKKRYMIKSSKLSYKKRTYILYL